MKNTKPIKVKNCFIREAGNPKGEGGCARIVSFFLALLVLFLPAAPAAAQWIEYLRDEDGTVFSFHKKLNIDKKNEKHIVQVLGKENISDAGREKYLQSLKQKGLPAAAYKQLSRKMFLCEIDCREKRIRKASLTAYDTNGKVIFSGENPSPEWEPILSDSTGEALQKSVCK